MKENWNLSPFWEPYYWVDVFVVRGISVVSIWFNDQMRCKPQIRDWCNWRVYYFTKFRDTQTYYNEHKESPSNSYPF